MDCNPVGLTRICNVCKALTIILVKMTCINSHDPSKLYYQPETFKQNLSQILNYPYQRVIKMLLYIRTYIFSLPPQDFRKQPQSHQIKAYLVIPFNNIRTLHFQMIPSSNTLGEDSRISFCYPVQI